MAAPSTQRVSTPEFMTSSAAGELVAELIRLGTETYRSQQEAAGTATFAAAIERAGRRAVAELLAVHGLTTSGQSRSS